MFNNFLSNSAIIYVVGKTSSLRKTLKTLLLNLAFTDFGVGLIIQPSQWSQQSIDDYNLKYAFFINLSTFCIAWVFWLYVWSGSPVAYKLIVAGVISIWLSCVVFSVVVVWLLSDMYLFIFL